MSDQKPPRLASDERSTVLALLQYQRTSFVRKVSHVSENAARWSPVASGTSLLWLTLHMARAESLWVLHRFAGQDALAEHDHVGPEDTMAAAVAQYRQTWELVDAVVSATPNLDEPCRRLGDENSVNLRWVLMHLLEETARHAGHADILREMLDRETGR